MSLLQALRLFVVGNVLIVGMGLSAEGQSSESALVRIQATEAKTDPMESFLPEKVGKFTRMGAARAYTKDNLYEYIDGHAEFFISAGFNHLVVGDYSATGSEGDVPDIIVEIYDMMKGIQAFGVLSDESGGETGESSQSSFGTDNAQGINFTSGRYFIKVLSFSAEAPIRLFQEQISLKVGSVYSKIPEFSRFPDVGKVVKTRFIRESYRGMSFLKDVIERKYIADGKSFDVSMVLGNKDEIKKITESFVEYFGQSGVKYSAVENSGRTIYKVQDQYEGDWTLIPLSDAIFGVYGVVDAAVIAKIVNASKE
jgi:hypothetical protein